MSCVMYDLHVPDEQTIQQAIDDARRGEVEPIPDYAHDVHTMKGRQAGRTKQQFFIEEHDALSQRVPGLFDDDLEALRRAERRLGKKRREANRRILHLSSWCCAGLSAADRSQHGSRPNIEGTACRPSGAAFAQSFL